MPSDLDTYEELLQQLALDSDYLIKENAKPIVVWEVDEMLELKRVDGDKTNGNLQLEEHGAGFGDGAQDFCEILLWDLEICRLGNYSIIPKLVVIKVVSSSIVVAAIYFQYKIFYWNETP